MTLRLLGGLTTDEVARAFLIPEKTIAQRSFALSGRSAKRAFCSKFRAAKNAPNGSPRCSK